MRNILELRKYFKTRINDYDLVHFHVGNLIEMFLIWLLLPRIQAIRVVTVWQPYLGISELITLPKILRGQLRGVIHHYLTNTCIHIPLFWIGNRYFDKIIVSSNYQKRQLKFIDGRKIAVIANGAVYPDNMRTTSPGGDNKLLYIGHHTAVKGIDVILEALQQIRGKINFSMTLALSDYGNEDVQDKIGSYGLDKEIVLKGKVDVYEEMINHDLFIMPLKTSVGTTYYPNVLLECFATGLPVIATSLDVIQEVVIDGKTGILIPAGRSDVLGKAILDTLSQEDVLSAMSVFQKEEFEEKYTLSKSVERHVNLYDSLLKKENDCFSIE